MELDAEAIKSFPVLGAEGVKWIGDIWYNCGSSSDIATIVKLTVSPDPPQKGQNMTVTAAINLSEEVTGGNVKVYVKFGFLPVHDKTLDLCNVLKEVGEICPIQAGTATKTMTLEIPSAVPGGLYTGSIKAVNQSGDEILCIDFDLQL